MEAEDHKWIQMAMKHIKKGAFTKMAQAHGMTPMEYKEEVLSQPEKHTKLEKKRAQFLENIQPKEKHMEPVKSEPAEVASPKTKAKRAPTEWNKLVQKHYAMTKGEPDAFAKAIKMAKAERASGAGKVTKEEAVLEAPNPKKRVSKKKDLTN